MPIPNLELVCLHSGISEILKLLTTFTLCGLEIGWAFNRTLTVVVDRLLKEQCFSKVSGSAARF